MRKTYPRLIAVLLLLSLVVGLFPMGVFADGLSGGDGTEVSTGELVTDPTEAIQDPSEPTQAPAEPATGPSVPEVTEGPTEGPTEEPTTAPAEAVDPSNTTTLTAETSKTKVQVVAQYEEATPKLQISEVDPEDQELNEITEMYSINGVNDLIAFDISLTGSDSATVEITFKEPYLQVLGYDMTYLIVRSGDSLERVEDYSLYADDSNIVTHFEFTQNIAEARIYLISSDQAKSTGVGKGCLYSSPTIRTKNMQQYHGVGDSKGQLPNHTWELTSPARTDFAICLNKNLPYVYNSANNAWGAGDVTAKTGTPSSGTPTANHWSGLSEALREKLILLICYGMDTNSPSARYGSSSDTEDPNGTKGTTYAAIQLVAWEWIDGVSEGEYTEHYAEAHYSTYSTNVHARAAELRNLVATNPDGIDASATKVKLVWSTMQKNDYGNHWTYGQTLIALTESPVYKPKTGSLAAQKYVKGSNLKSGWVFEIYSNASDAYSRTNRLATAVTDTNGVATFNNLEAGKFYYIMEAVASEQTNDTTNWTLSHVDLGATVVAGTTTWATNITGATITNVYNPKRAFSLVKSIKASDSCIAQIKDNPLYSLAGAQYQVTVNGVYQETLTTDANGYAASSKEYDVGTVVKVKETVAPNGFKLNSKTYTLTITNGTNQVAVEDEPLFDPPFAITKIDKDTTTAQGNGSFSGAVFKWEYYANYNWSGKATRTWYFKTDANGIADYQASYLALDYSSDELYYNNSGVTQLPLGSVKITEIKNSLGYIVMPQSLKCTIVRNDSSAFGVDVVWDAASSQIIKDFSSGNFGVPEPIDETLFGSLTVDKIDSVLGSMAQGGATLAGAKFQVINNSTNSVKIGSFAEAKPGEVCYEFTVDGSGRFYSGNIFPLGRYTVKEVVPPTGYLLNTGWSKSFTVTATDRDFSFTAGNGSACPDNVILGGLRIVKKDAILGDLTGADAYFSGITFKVISNNAQPVVVNGSTYQNGDTVLNLEINWDGSRWVIESGNVLPYGNYTVTENVNANGWANDYYTASTESYTVEIREQGVTIEKTFTNSLRPGKLEIHKLNTQGQPLEGSKFLLEWSLDGENWTPATYSDNQYPALGTCGTVGLADGCLISGSDGLVSFTNLHPALQYRLTEVETVPGYTLNTEPIYTGKLPLDTLQLGWNVVNGRAYTLPATGSFSLMAMPIALAGLLTLGGVLLMISDRKSGEA